MNVTRTSKELAAIASHIRAHAAGIYNFNAFRSRALDAIADEIESLSGGNPSETSACLPADDRGIAEARSSEGGNGGQALDVSIQSREPVGSDPASGGAGELEAKDKATSVDPAPVVTASPYESMFRAAVASLAEISQALGIPDDVAATANGNEEILEAIANLVSMARAAAEDIERQRRELAEHEASFDLRWNASQRAIKRWQEAHPGNDLVWPDHADMCVWMLGEIERLRDALESLLPGLILDLRYADLDDDRDAMQSRIDTVTAALGNGQCPAHL